MRDGFWLSLENGGAQPLAANAEERLPEFPNVPTLTEQGYPDIGTLHWLGIFARTGAPDHVLTVLHKAANEAVNQPKTQELLRKQSMRPFLKKTPAEAREWLRGELVKWEGIVKELNMTFD